MSMVKFSPIALNFGYDFVLLVHFFGTPCISEHLVKGPKKQEPERDAILTKPNPVSLDVVMICKTCKLDSSILDVDPSARLTCNSIYENKLFLQSYVFQGAFRLLL